MDNLSEDVSQAQQSHCTREFTAAITDKVKPDKIPAGMVEGIVKSHPIRENTAIDG